MENLNFDNLKQNKCPKCGYLIKDQHIDIYKQKMFHPCGLILTLGEMHRMKEAVEDKVVHDK